MRRTGLRLLPEGSGKGSLGPFEWRKCLAGLKLEQVCVSTKDC